MVNGHDTDRARAALHSIDPGCSREQWVKVAMGAKAAGLSFEHFENWSRNASNYKSQHDCRAVWESITVDGGIGAGTLFKVAHDGGWAAPTAVWPIDSRCTAENERAIYAAALWDACEQASLAHGYILRKGGTPDGLRVYRGPLSIAGQPCDGTLVVPAVDLHGRIVSMQFIPEGRGKKLFLKGAKLSHDAHFVVGGPIQGGACYVTEGIGQAWAAHQASRAPAVVCFGAGRMAGVAEALHRYYPELKLVVVADAGKETAAETIARQVGGSWVSMPAGSPANYDLNDVQQERGIVAVASLLAGAKETGSRFKLMSADELASHPPVRWTIRGVLPQTGMAALFGPSGSGKSFLAIDMAFAVAAGREWFGYRVNACPVTYCALEGEAGVAGRVKAYRIKHGQVPSNVLYLTQPLNLLTDVAELADAILAAGGGSGMVILDTLNRATPESDENDSKDMGRVIAAAKILQAKIGGLVVLVHHTGKDSSKGLRGHSSLLAALDAAIEVRRDGERRGWKVHKSKDGQDGATSPFRLNIVEIGMGEDGEVETSCVVAPIREDAAQPAIRAFPPKAGNQRIVWDALDELFRATKDYGKAQAPASRPCLRLEDAVAAARVRLVCDPKRQAERTQSAINALVAKELLVHMEGWLWRP